MSMNWADVYGIEASPVQIAAPISSAGPYQSSVNPAFSGPGTVAQGGTAPAISLLGIVVALVALRVAIELSEQA